MRGQPSEPRLLLLLLCGVFGWGCGPAPADSRVGARGPASGVGAGSEQDRGASLDELAGNGQWEDLIEALDRSGSIDEGSNRRLLARAIKRMEPKALEQLYARLKSPEIRMAAAHRLATVAVHVGNDRAAKRWLAQLDKAQHTAEKSAATALRSDLGRTGDDRLVAVLLPLSGPHSSLGREVRAAVELARRGDRSVRLVYYDTTGTAQGSLAAVNRAATEGKPLVFLGPIGVAESTAAAARASALRIPIAVLAPVGGGRLGADGVFRMIPSPTWEAERAALLAVDLQFDRVAVLAPRDSVGRTQAKAFAKTAKAAGAKVVRIGDYDPTATDLEPDIKEFLGLDPQTNARLRRHLARNGRSGWKSFSPDVPFELLYVPDTVKNASLVASYLPFYNVELRVEDLMDATAYCYKHGGRVPQLVQLLGSSAWNHPSLFAHGGRAVEGALILDVCAGGDFGEVISDARVQFDRRFSQRTGRSAGSLAAQSFDAATMVLKARQESAGATLPRRAFERALVTTRLGDGACGSARMSATGEIVRDPIALRVGRDEFLIHDH